MVWTRLGLCMLMLASGGCATTSTINGLPSIPEQLSVDPMAAAEAESKYIRALSLRGGLEGVIPVNYSADWYLIQRAGIRDIGSRCDEYLNALFRFNRQQQAIRTGLTSTAAATGTIMSIAGAASAAFGIVTAAFGLSSSLFDATTNSVLFTIEPSALRNVVLQGLDKYAKIMDASRPTTRPDTMIQLQGYLAQCSPASIEANINLAANGSPNAVTNSSGLSGLNAARMAGSAITSREKAEAIIDKPVQPNPPPAQKTTDTRLPGEDPLPPDLVRLIQGALKVKDDGLMGGANSETRTAIKEFELGLIMQPGSAFTKPTGAYAGQTRFIIPITPMPAELESAFERAYLTVQASAAAGQFNEIDPRRLRALATALKLPPDTPSLKDMRAKIREQRVERGLDKKETAKSYVDSAFWALIRPQ